MSKKLGFIFDWDGVVVHSNDLHELTWFRLAEEEGKPRPTATNLGNCGMKTDAVLTRLLRWEISPSDMDRLSFRKEELFRKLVAEQGIESISGVTQFLKALKKHRIPHAVGSSAPRLNIDAGMKALKLENNFDAIVAGEDVIHGKPAPDIFLKAAAAMGLKPEQCVVFEDAPAGVEAARAAGMKVIGILSTHEPAALSRATRLARDFTEIELDELLKWGN
jgi:beta-phosphoglucomutase family hydrolase